MAHPSRCFNATTKSLLSSYARVGAPAIDQSSRLTRAVHLRRHHDVRLKETRCVITGASRGIGKAIALALARSRASCLLIGRDETALNATLSDCNAASSETSSSAVSHSVTTGDVSSYDFWQSLKLPGDRVDILVNAAGITHSSLFLRESPSSMERIVQTNLMGTMWASKVLAKKMMRNKSVPDRSFMDKGCIINIASLLATHGGAGSSIYVASKAGVVGLTRALAAELGPAGIRVNCILPGYIETDMTRAMTPQAREEALSKIPLKRFGSAEEIADAAVFLAANSYANNCVVNLDGGLSATVSALKYSRLDAC